jgi:adenylate kinase
MLAKRNQKLDVALALDVSRDLLMERAVLRRTDKRTGRIYHLKYNPPPPELAETELEHRADDREEVVKNRLDTYDKMTAELLPWYEKAGLLKRVNGVGTVEEVTRRVMDALARN